MFKKFISWAKRRNLDGTPLWKALIFQYRIPARYHEKIDYPIKKILSIPFLLIIYIFFIFISIFYKLINKKFLKLNFLKEDSYFEKIIGSEDYKRQY